MSIKPLERSSLASIKNSEAFKTVKIKDAAPKEIKVDETRTARKEQFQKTQEEPEQTASREKRSAENTRGLDQEA